MPHKGSYSDATSSFMPQKGGYFNDTKNNDINQLISMLSTTSESYYTANSTDTEQLKNKLFNIIGGGGDDDDDYDNDEDPLDLTKIKNGTNSTKIAEAAFKDSSTYDKTLVSPLLSDNTFEGTTKDIIIKVLNYIWFTILNIINNNNTNIGWYTLVLITQFEQLNDINRYTFIVIIYGYIYYINKKRININKELKKDFDLKSIIIKEDNDILEKITKYIYTHFYDLIELKKYKYLDEYGRSIVKDEGNNLYEAYKLVYNMYPIDLTDPQIEKQKLTIFNSFNPAPAATVAPAPASPASAAAAAPVARATASVVDSATASATASIADSATASIADSATAPTPTHAPAIVARAPVAPVVVARAPVAPVVVARAPATPARAPVAVSIQL
jgi:hypothetical protein